MDKFWQSYEECLNKVAAEGDSVDKVIEICKSFFGTSSGDAFFPGGGDRDLISVLSWDRNDWDIYWSAANYHWKAEDSHGNRFEYVEGDISRLEME